MTGDNLHALDGARSSWWHLLPCLPAHHCCHSFHLYTACLYKYTCGSWCLCCHCFLFWLCLLLFVMYANSFVEHELYGGGRIPLNNPSVVWGRECIAWWDLPPSYWTWIPDSRPSWVPLRSFPWWTGLCCGPTGYIPPEGHALVYFSSSFFPLCQYLLWRPAEVSRCFRTGFPWVSVSWLSALNPPELANYNKVFLPWHGLQGAFCSSHF